MTHGARARAEQAGGAAPGAEQDDGSGVRCRPRVEAAEPRPPPDPMHDTVVDARPPGAWAEQGGRPREGERLVGGRWRLLRTLGVGGMAAIHEDEDLETGDRVAVKLLHVDADAVQQHEEVRFRREAHLAATIRHPNIVRVLAAGRCRDGRLYQVQELLEGEELGAVMERGRLGTGLAVGLAVQVLSALAEVHQHDFVHRDVKPANIFLARGLSGSTRVKLLDFGIAKHVRPEDGLHALTVAGATIGTPHYMSPEQALAKPVSASSDLWSVGVVLYHALAGHPPFDAEELHELLLRIANDPAPSLRDARPDLPTHVVDAVDRALRNDPVERWRSARRMAAALLNAT